MQRAASFATVDPLVLHRSMRSTSPKATRKSGPVKIVSEDKLKAPRTRKNCSGIGIELMSDVATVGTCSQTIHWKYMFLLKHTDLSAKKEAKAKKGEDEEEAGREQAGG